MVDGRLLDAGTGAHVEGARVELLGPDGRVRRQALTGKDGVFRLSVPAPGRYRVRALRLGYATGTSPWLDIGEAGSFAVELRLLQSPVPLEPVTVLGAMHSRPALKAYLEGRGYYQRKAAYGIRGLGFGYFLEGDELPPNASRVSDLLRELPGMYVRGAGGTKTAVMGRSCPPDFFLDGTFIGKGGTDEVEEALPPATDIAAIEAYPGSVAPAEYLRFGSRNCGVVLLWTGIRP